MTIWQLLKTIQAWCSRVSAEYLSSSHQPVLHWLTALGSPAPHSSASLCHCTEVFLFVWLRICTERRNVVTKRIPIEVQSSSCLVHLRVKTADHVVTYYATDATAKCKKRRLCSSLSLPALKELGLRVLSSWESCLQGVSTHETTHLSQLHNDPSSSTSVTIWGQLWQMTLVTPRWNQQAGRFMLTEQVHRFFYAHLPAVINFVAWSQSGEEKKKTTTLK